MEQKHVMQTITILFYFTTLLIVIQEII